MRRLEQWERDNLTQSLREGFCWGLGLMPSLVIAALIFDAIFMTSTAMFLDAMSQVKP